MTVRKKISKGILLLLFAAMQTSGVSCIIQAYFSFKSAATEQPVNQAAVKTDFGAF